MSWYHNDPRPVDSPPPPHDALTPKEIATIVSTITVFIGLVVAYFYWRNRKAKKTQAKRDRDAELTNLPPEDKDNPSFDTGLGGPGGNDCWPTTIKSPTQPKPVKKSFWRSFGKERSEKATRKENRSSLDAHTS